MKNGTIALTLALLLVLSLAGCGSSEPQTSATTQAATGSTTSTETTTGFEDLEAIGELEVDQNLFTVDHCSCRLPWRRHYPGITGFRCRRIQLYFRQAQ